MVTAIITVMAAHPSSRALVQLIVEADEAKLTQALQNPIADAIHHTPEGVPIVVCVGQREDEYQVWAVVDVHDEGPGVPQELVPLLFERHAAQDDSAGFRLGLCLASGIARAHGVDLTVESKAGRGTTFTLTVSMPAAPQQSCNEHAD